MFILCIVYILCSYFVDNRMPDQTIGKVIKGINIIVLSVYLTVIYKLN